MKYKKYEVFTKRGEVVFTGTAKECAEFMNVSYGCFRVAVRQTETGERTGRKGVFLARKIYEGEKNTYEVYDQEGNMIQKGDLHKISEFLKCKPVNVLYKARRDRTHKHKNNVRYRIVTL